MKRWLPVGAAIVGCILASGATATTVARAESPTTADCDHNVPTIAALRQCVLHAEDAGHIDNPGVACSLLSILDAAQRALDRGDKATAIRALDAFIAEVSAQTGKHIAANHAEELIAHADAVIEAISSASTRSY